MNGKVLVMTTPAMFGSCIAYATPAIQEKGKEKKEKEKKKKERNKYAIQLDNIHGSVQRSMTAKLHTKP